MISDALLDAARCPDCAGELTREAGAIRCRGCARRFVADRGLLDLRPHVSFSEQTKYLDEALHADARHESIAPPLLGSYVRQTMLTRFLAPARGDRVLDLGCGNGRALSWNAPSSAWLVGVDVSPFVSPEATERADLVLGDLRKLPFKDARFSKAWALDVFEHLSPDALRDVLAEINRVLEPGGQLFVYTHVRQNGWIAGGVRAVNALARVGERAGLLDLKQERLRKSDHLNPIATHDELAAVLARSGFTLERVTYYTPIIGAFVENILARIAERILTRRAASRAPQAPDSSATRSARASAQARVRRGGATYRALHVVSRVMMLDVALFGRLRSGPFFALIRKTRALDR